ncbi:M23 family metallopeptidase [Paenibacillus sp. NFR01]|uniref:M23 family metallopeptidase n=1 Tax=Paenibacillus sp. NFR01 TaxID=1566279 RepID=UPI0008C14E56|nr:peptidoglycan DD-metalloendopeptidase family protein [Paenibacillus sp. NFR01]SET98774.1 Peptidase family M23 [Paenibacillus sp. NFR01]
MKRQPDHNRITLLVVRDAGRPVRQLQLSKPMALALPAAAALSISSLVTSMHYHASRSIADLEAEAAALSLTNMQMEIKVADKEQTLQQLRSQVTELSEEAENIKDKLKNVNELEAKLQSLIDQEQEGSSKGSDSDSDTTALQVPDGSGTVSAATLAMSPVIQSSALSAVPAIQFRLGPVSAAVEHNVTPQVGGEYVAVYEPLEQARETKDDFEDINRMLDEMVSSITTTITEAEQANRLEASLAAKKAQAEKARLAPAVIWPTNSRVITSSFGYRTDPFNGTSAYHSGIDIAGKIGDPVYAAMDGVIVAADQMSARGKYIIIQHKNGLQTWYMHLNKMIVTAGDTVKKGEQIGLLGNTGRSTGPHLHFQVLKNDQAVNPLAYTKP